MNNQPNPRPTQPPPSPSYADMLVLAPSGLHR